MHAYGQSMLKETLLGSAEIRFGRRTNQPLRALGDRAARSRICPGPKGLPLVGNMPQLDAKRLHCVLERWADAYAPLYKFKIGNKPVVAIAEAEVINPILRHRQDAGFRTGCHPFLRAPGTAGGDSARRQGESAKSCQKSQGGRGMRVGGDSLGHGDEQFASAHYLAGDLDPDAVAITSDPANMVIEGKEDWGYGIHLLREHVANVHIKNVSWLRERDCWQWRWDGLREGMVDWPQLFRLLADAEYRGTFAMEDFRVPRTFDVGLSHSRELYEETRLLRQQSESRLAA